MRPQTPITPALALAPDFAEAHNNLGNLLADRGQVEAAMTAYRRATDLQPENAAATAQLYYQCQLACDWAEVERLALILDRQTDAALAAGQCPGETPFGALARPLSPARRGAIAQAWAPETRRRTAPPACPNLVDELSDDLPWLVSGQLGPREVVHDRSTASAKVETVQHLRSPGSVLGLPDHVRR